MPPITNKLRKLPRETKDRKRARLLVFWESIELKHAVWHFIRYERIADIVNRMEGKQILDVGCGTGLLDLLINNKDIIGIDIDRKSLKNAIRIREGYRLRNNAFYPLIADLNSLPLNRKFDAVVCSEVLEHLPDYRRALEVLLSFLKEDGIMLITLPNALRLEFPQLFRLALRPEPLCTENQRLRTSGSAHLREFRVNDLEESILRLIPLKAEKVTGIYLDFPLFHIFNLPVRVLSEIKFSKKFLFFAHKAFYQMYVTFWTPIERLYWHHAYFILMIFRNHRPHWKQA